MKKPKKSNDRLISGIFLATLGSFAFSDAVAISIYFAGDMPPTISDRSPESSLCYRFKVDSLETQMKKLKRKYSDSLLAARIDVTNEGLVLTAHRFDVDGRRIDYFYSDQPEVCDTYQRLRGVSLSAQDTPPTSSTEPIPAKPDPAPDIAVLKDSLADKLVEWQKAASQGNAEAQLFLGLMYLMGQGVPQDNRKALLWMQKSAAQGNAMAQLSLGGIYRAGKVVTQDFAQAMDWWEKAAAQGNAEAQYNLGLMYALGEGVTQDYAQAIDWWQKAAAQGLAKAQFKLGTAYALSEGVPQDFAQALGWWQKAAAQGDIEAQYNLGMMYATGQGVTQDYAQAVQWWQKAASSGLAIAQYDLGKMYEMGQGVTLDYAQAVQWWQKAAAQGYAKAQYNLGSMYSNGKGVLQDYHEAAKWYRLAAEQNDAMAQTNLGLMYEIGLGMPQDWVIAYALYNLAAAHGNELAISNREQLIGKLTSRQIEEGQKISRLWKPGTPLPLQSETGAAPEPSPASTAPTTPEVSSTGDCRPTGTAIRCQSRCINGDCILTYENGCKIRVQVRPSFNSFNNQWEYPSPSC